ncbi:sensor histidine kinase [Mobiluncus mulieris]|uniref:histidine kinase n=1 Tax=Mobiluncus mulieris TaxID=2052 RepID=A0ABD4TVT3_9ACTO|nr:histidine kinase [Mobiluncus mulieris]MCU9968984.1 histidine kinase [Mobiluncus mulieris]MCU9973673.1 histidine kinase [Mobiluncus mulieris]MCV0009329.1 histidine kinase [Mobiluncus mulieris]NMW75118.1 histidine kinase [Mobiluncus mulieris]NMX01061.1 histidine kinase [Mobiluncus mulieris]
MKQRKQSRCLAWLKHWLKRYWYPLVVVGIELMQLMNLLYKDTSMIQWITWVAILIPALASIRFRHMGLVTVCVVYMGLAVSPVPVSFSIEFIWFAVGYLCATSPAVMGISAGTLVIAASAWGMVLADEPFFTALYASSFDVVPIVVGLSIANYRRLYEVERENRRLQLAAQSQVFATKVHDSVSHALVQISILSSPRTDKTEVVGDEQLRRIHELSARGLREMRDLVQELQLQSKQWSGDSAVSKIAVRTSRGDIPTSIAGADLEDALQEFADTLQRSGFELNLQLRGNLEEVSDTKTLVLRDCLREMATNALKYANPNYPVILLLRTTSERIYLYSANQINPKDMGFPSTNQGLVGIRHRVEAFGGTVTTNIDDTSWIISLTL